MLSLTSPALAAGGLAAAFLSIVAGWAAIQRPSSERASALAAASLLFNVTKSYIVLSPSTLPILPLALVQQLCTPMMVLLSGSPNVYLAF